MNGEPYLCPQCGNYGAENVPCHYCAWKAKKAGEAAEQYCEIDDLIRQYVCGDDTSSEILLKAGGMARVLQEERNTLVDGFRELEDANRKLRERADGLKDRVMDAIYTEEELDGPMPDSVRDNIEKFGLEESLRLLVRLTKRNIREAVKRVFAEEDQRDEVRSADMHRDNPDDESG